MEEFAISPEKPDKQEAIQAIADLGFEKIGNGDLFEKDNFVIFVNENGDYELSVDYNGSEFNEIMPLKFINGIKLGTDPRNFCLVFFSERPLQFKIKSPLNASHDDVYCYERSLNGGGGPIWNQQNIPMAQEFEGKPIPEQLLEIGFKECDFGHQDEKVSKRVFRFKVTTQHGFGEVIAVTDGERLYRLLKPVDERVRRYLRPGTKVIDSTTEKNRYGESNSYLMLSNDLVAFTASSYIGGMAGNFDILREVRQDELNIKPLVIAEEPSGFRVGGANPTELIRTLESINNKDVFLLEYHMSPMRDSYSGFLGKGEKLLKVMAEDNDFVLSQGLTHQDLAEPLKYIVSFFHELPFAFSPECDFEYQGQKYRVHVASYRGFQESPFRDGTKGSLDVRVIHLDTGKTISFPSLVAHMIERYGFYEGKKTNYRVEPKDILEVFPHLKEKGKRQLSRIQEEVESRRDELKTKIAEWSNKVHDCPNSAMRSSGKFGLGPNSLFGFGDTPFPFSANMPETEQDIKRQINELLDKIMKSKK